MVNWRKSSYSNSGGGACVEVADGAQAIMIRDTTNRDGGSLSVSASAWAAFIGGIR
jgi:hypothetical protein